MPYFLLKLFICTAWSCFANLLDFFGVFFALPSQPMPCFIHFLGAFRLSISLFVFPSLSDSSAFYLRCLCHLCHCLSPLFFPCSVGIFFSFSVFHVLVFLCPWPPRERKRAVSYRNKGPRRWAVERRSLARPTPWRRKNVEQKRPPTPTHGLLFFRARRLCRACCLYAASPRGAEEAHGKQQRPSMAKCFDVIRV